MTGPEKKASTAPIKEFGDAMDEGYAIIDKTTKELAQLRTDVEEKKYHTNIAVVDKLKDLKKELHTFKNRAKEHLDKDDWTLQEIRTNLQLKETEIDQELLKDRSHLNSVEASTTGIVATVQSSVGWITGPVFGKIAESAHLVYASLIEPVMSGGGALLGKMGSGMKNYLAEFLGMLGWKGAKDYLLNTKKTPEQEAEHKQWQTYTKLADTLNFHHKVILSKVAEDQPLSPELKEKMNILAIAMKGNAVDSEKGIAYLERIAKAMPEGSATLDQVIDKMRDIPVEARVQTEAEVQLRKDYAELLEGFGKKGLVLEPLATDKVPAADVTTTLTAIKAALKNNKVDAAEPKVKTFVDDLVAKVKALNPGKTQFTLQQILTAAGGITPMAA